MYLIASPDFVEQEAAVSQRCAQSRYVESIAQEDV